MTYHNKSLDYQVRNSDKLFQQFLKLHDYMTKDPYEFSCKCLLKEMKFKVGDKVSHKQSPHIWRTITAIMSDGTYVLDSEIYDVKESDLEPYTTKEKEQTEFQERILSNPNRPTDKEIMLELAGEIENKENIE